jgi:asparagine synthase (glutamine-hydrolysing)
VCGIAGIYHLNGQPASKEHLQKMTSCISYRGPDGEGFFTDGSVGLGHRRLAIIDLATGRQPMFSEDRSIAITFNGEIYNYLELRAELIKIGKRFHTESDTEVILRAYEAWGIECQTRLNGMWAFAIWDSHKRRLFLSRDRMGEKPLHYALHKEAFVFASEIKSLLAYGIPRAPRTDLTEVYLSMGYVPAPYTYFQGIQKLRPGHCLTIESGKVTERAYWKLLDIDEQDMVADKNLVHEQFTSLLDDAVRLRMRCDVPFGAFLSGGLDSSSIVALMTRHTKQRIRTFTIGFPEKEFDERPLARLVADKFQTEHHEGVVEPDTFDASIERILHHYDEPFGDSSAIPTGYVSRYARQHVKMVLTGDGGDEVLSGYTSYQGEKFASYYQRLPDFIQLGLPALSDLASLPLRGALRYRLNRVAKVCTSAGAPFNTRLIQKLASISPVHIKQLTEGISGIWPIEEFIADLMRDCRYQDPFYRLMHFHLRVSLPDDMLTKVDRMSMAHSLETRVPFLDHRLVEFMATVHKDVKMLGFQRKAVLRHTVANSLPPPLLKAPKRGFVVPLREWFKGDTLRAHLRKLSNQEFGVRRDVVQGIVSANESGKADYGNFIWMLFILSGWYAGNGKCNA